MSRERYCVDRCDRTSILGIRGLSRASTKGAHIATLCTGVVTIECQQDCAQPTQNNGFSAVVFGKRHFRPDTYPLWDSPRQIDVQLGALSGGESDRPAALGAASASVSCWSRRRRVYKCHRRRVVSLPPTDDRSWQTGFDHHPTDGSRKKSFEMYPTRRCAGGSRRNQRTC